MIKAILFFAVYWQNFVVVTFFPSQFDWLTRRIADPSDIINENANVRVLLEINVFILIFNYALKYLIPPFNNLHSICNSESTN